MVCAKWARNKGYLLYIVLWYSSPRLFEGKKMNFGNWTVRENREGISNKYDRYNVSDTEVKFKAVSNLIALNTKMKKSYLTTTYYHYEQGGNPK